VVNASPSSPLCCPCCCPHSHAYCPALPVPMSLSCCLSVAVIALMLPICVLVPLLLLFPPCEQLLVAVVRGAAVVGIWSCYHLTTPSSWQWWGWLRGGQLSLSIVKSLLKIVLVSNKETKRKKLICGPREGPKQQ
jgi:hypothetical protein